MPERFMDRLACAVAGKRSSVCVGLDPLPAKLPADVWPDGQRSGDPAQQARAVLEFNRRVIDAVCESAVAVKPQIAFYERLGAAGWLAYVRTIEAAHRKGLIVIGDIKRGDIGSTAAAYAEAHLGTGAEYADAITLNPLFGSDGLQPFIERAQQTGAGLYLLVRTSNPSAAELQDLAADGQPLYLWIARLLSKLMGSWTRTGRYHDLGAVVGATNPEQLRVLRAALPRAPFLLPGYGAQGASARDCLPAFDADGNGALVNSSRGIIYAFESAPHMPWQAAVAQAAERMRDDLPPRRCSS
ncbi:MAG: orotidine-5'-phosphate decarboxylase [Planctomycetota bacterium]